MVHQWWCALGICGLKLLPQAESEVEYELWVREFKLLFTTMTAKRASTSAMVGKLLRITLTAACAVQQAGGSSWSLTSEERAEYRDTAQNCTDCGNKFLPLVRVKHSCAKCGFAFCKNCMAPGTQLCKKHARLQEVRAVLLLLCAVVC